MKYLIFLLSLLLISCDTTYNAPFDKTYLITLPNGEVIQTNKYIIKENGIHLFYSIYKVNKYDTFDIKLVPYQKNLIYDKGYRQGQIDALENKICFAKVLNDNGEIIWRDTCSFKPIPKL